MSTLNGISYQELEGSGRLVFTSEGIRGQRIFTVDWADRIAFAKALLGYTNAVGHKPIRREAQVFPGYERLYCQNAEVSPLGQASQDDEMISYAKARILAEYMPLNFGTSISEGDGYSGEDEDERLHIEEMWDFSSEVMSVDGGHFEYSDTSAKLTEPVSVLVGTVDLTLSSDSEPELPGDTIRQCLGKVNSGEWFGASAEHVLFLGASARRVLTVEGERAWYLSYRFRQRQVSWNKRLRGATWVEVDPKPYQTCDFSVLL
jgi:hypothetical protein